MSLRGGHSPTKQSPLKWIILIDEYSRFNGDCFTEERLAMTYTINLQVYLLSFIIPAAMMISHRSTVGSAADS